MRRLRDSLDQQRARILTRAIEVAASENETSALIALVDRLELLDKLRKAQTAQHDTRDGLLVTLCLASILGILLALHVPAATQVTAAVDNVRFTATHVEVSGQASYANGTAKFSASTPAGVAVEQSGSAMLKVIQAYAGSTPVVMSLTRAGECDQLTVTDGNLDITLINDAGETTSSSVVTMTARPGSAASSLTLCGAVVSPLLLKMHVLKIALARDALDGTAGSGDEPVIKKGMVRFGHEQYPLSPSDLLYMETAPDRSVSTPRQLRISSSKDGYLVQFSGRVRHLYFGSDIEVERMPNVLEYLLKDSPWLSVYSALAGAIGLIWGIRKIIRGG